jgi:hypothetical protein
METLISDPKIQSSHEINRNRNPSAFPENKSCFTYKEWRISLGHRWDQLQLIGDTDIFVLGNVGNIKCIISIGSSAWAIKGSSSDHQEPAVF